MKVPVVGLTLRPYQADGGPLLLARNRAYFEALESSGGAVLPIPVTASAEHLRALYELCDALCLPGGPDVAPRMYGEETRADCNVDVDSELDALETTLLSWALDDDLPVLAICRGMQLLNVALGGTLWQDIGVQLDTPLRHQHAISHQDLTHEVEVAADSRLRGLTRTARAEVNSRHHQAVREAAPALTVTALAPDGVVEAVEDSDRRFLVGVQCHPEDLYPRLEWSRRLFQSFVASATGG